MNITTPDSARLIKEAYAHFSLGLVDEAGKQIDQYIEAVGEDASALEMRCRIACLRDDYQAAAKIVRDQPEYFTDPLNAMNVVNISGDPAWAYSNCLLMADVHASDPSYWFNRSCFASRVGAFPDALLSLIKSFRTSTRYHSDAFLDPDFNSLWTWMEEAPLTDDDVEILTHWGWTFALRAIGTAGHELTLTPLMRPHVPENFRRYLPVGSTQCGLFALPTMPGGLYREYLEWQKATAGTNVKRVRAVVARAREQLARSQVRFAYWQARNGNPTAARYHVLQHLSMIPNGISQLEGLRRLGMAALLDDITQAMEEDMSFAEKIQTPHDLTLGHEEIRDVLDNIGPVGKQTTMFKLRLANLENETGHVQESIQLLSAVIRAWPEDAAAYSRLTDLFISEGHWEKARLSFHASPAHYGQFWRRAYQLQMIENENLCIQRAGHPAIDIFYGQRNLGGALKPGFFPGSEEASGPAELALVAG